ncbi:hypothetical protein [Eggerthella sinensis]|uniref:hypothetical protein n=1 Tax=Eggerthella sinensis TaxID=242230 RepID=UPI0022DEA5FB|nr:hypothetical protein [Eggerthella sinensis]
MELGDDAASVLFSVLGVVNRFYMTLDQNEQVEEFENCLLNEIGCLSFAAKARMEFEKEYDGFT